MLIRIGEFDITECWDGVFYKKLSRYPEITAWEIQTVLDYMTISVQDGCGRIMSAACLWTTGGFPAMMFSNFSASINGKGDRT